MRGSLVQAFMQRPSGIRRIPIAYPRFGLGHLIDHDPAKILPGTSIRTWDVVMDTSGGIKQRPGIGHISENGACGMQLSSFEEGGLWGGGQDDVVNFRPFKYSQVGTKARKIVAGAAGFYEATKLANLALGTNEEEYLNIWVYIADPSKIDWGGGGLRFELEKVLNTDLFRYNVPQADLAAGWTFLMTQKKDWTKIGAITVNDWDSIIRLHLKVNVNAATEITFDNWWLGPSHLTGLFNFRRSPSKGGGNWILAAGRGQIDVYKESERRFVPLITGLSPYQPVNFDVLEDKCIAVNGKDRPRLIISDTQAYLAGYDAPTAAPTIELLDDGEMVVGNHRYAFVAYSSLTGDQSNPFRPDQTAIDADHRGVLLKDFPFLADPKIDYYRIYRLAPGEVNYKRISTDLLGEIKNELPVTGVAQGAGPSTKTIQLALADPATVNDEYVDRLITATTLGNSETQNVTDFDNATKVIVVETDWSIAIDATTTYSIQRVVRDRAANGVLGDVMPGYPNYLDNGIPPIAAVVKAVGKNVIYDDRAQGGRIWVAQTDHPELVPIDNLIALDEGDNDDIKGITEAFGYAVVMKNDAFYPARRGRGKQPFEFGDKVHDIGTRSHRSILFDGQRLHWRHGTGYHSCGQDWQPVKEGSGWDQPGFLPMSEPSLDDLDTSRGEMITAARLIQRGRLMWSETMKPALYPNIISVFHQDLGYAGRDMDKPLTGWAFHRPKISIIAEAREEGTHAEQIIGGGISGLVYLLEQPNKNDVHPWGQEAIDYDVMTPPLDLVFAQYGMGPDVLAVYKYVDAIMRPFGNYPLDIEFYFDWGMAPGSSGQIAGNFGAAFGSFAFGVSAFGTTGGDYQRLDIEPGRHQSIALRFRNNRLDEAPYISSFYIAAHAVREFVRKV